MTTHDHKVPVHFKGVHVLPVDKVAREVDEDRF